MNSLKCPQCGLVNFATALECKRCHVKFHQRELVSETLPPAEVQPPPLAAQTRPASPAPAFANQTVSPTSRGTFRAKPARLNALMILFALYLLLSAAVCLFQAVLIYGVWHTEAWKHMTDPNDMIYIPGSQLTSYFSALLVVLGLFASLLLLIPLLCRWHSFLKLVRIYLVASFFYFAVEITAGFGLRYALTQRIPINALTKPMLDGMYWASILKIIGFLVAFTWFQYFTTSERVKRTFTR